VAATDVVVVIEVGTVITSVWVVVIDSMASADVTAVARLVCTTGGAVVVATAVTVAQGGVDTMQEHATLITDSAAVLRPDSRLSLKSALGSSKAVAALLAGAPVVTVTVTVPVVTVTVDVPVLKAVETAVTTTVLDKVPVVVVDVASVCVVVIVGTIVKVLETVDVHRAGGKCSEQKLCAGG